METFDGKGRLVVQHDEHALYETSPGRFTLYVDDDPVNWGMSYPVARDLWHRVTHQTMAENIRVGSWREANPLLKQAYEECDIGCPICQNRFGIDAEVCYCGWKNPFSMASFLRR